MTASLITVGTNEDAAILNLCKLVRKTVENNGNHKGCQSYILLAAGYTAKQIARAADSGLIVAVKGKNGGYYPADMVPEKRESVSSLKERAFDLLEKLYNAGATDAYGDDMLALIDAYKQEKENRSKKEDAA